MLTLGTGVGSGLVLNGRIWHGLHGMAGELGHVSVIADGIECPCGGRGCLERYASATAIMSMGQKWFRDNKSETTLLNGKIDSPSTRDMAEMAAAGHCGMEQVFERVGYYLGLSIAGVVNTLDLPLYVVGGGVSDAWELFAPSLFRAVRDHSYVYQLCEPTRKEVPEAGKPFITRARLGTQAGLMGAAMVSLVNPAEATLVSP
jgi:glucokinase